MKKYLFICIFVLFSCSQEDVVQQGEKIITPEWSRGTWKEDVTNKLIIIEQNRISNTLMDVRYAEEDYKTNTTYRIFTNNFEVLILKTSNKMFFRYKESESVIINGYFEKQ